MLDALDGAPPSRPGPRPPLPGGTGWMLDVVPPGSPPSWAWLLTILVGGGVVPVAWVLGPSGVVALWLVGLSAAAAVFCTPPGERTLRVRGAGVWARSVGVVAAALVAAVGAAVAAGPPGLALWAAGLVTGWVLLVHERRPTRARDDGGPSSPPGGG